MLTIWTFECMEDFLDSHKVIWAEGTMKKYRASKNFFRDFNQQKKYGTSFGKIDLSITQRFRIVIIKYLFSNALEIFIFLM